MPVAATDDADLTARIEAYTGAGEILASQSTVDEAGTGLETGRSFSARPKGMAAEVLIHAITGLRGDDGALPPGTAAGTEHGAP